MYDKPPKMLAVELPEPVHRAMHQEAARQGIPAAKLVRNVLAEMPLFAPARIKPKPVRQLIK